MILTLDVPADLADQLQAAAAEGQDLNNYAVARLKDLFTETEEEDEEDADQDLIAALRAGIADRDAGRTVSLEETDNRIQAVLRERGEVSGPKGRD